jgi:plastocyanin
MRHARLLSFALLAIFAVVACATEGPGWTYAPAPVETPAPQPTDGAETPAPTEPPEGVVFVSASSALRFDQDTLEIEADTPFQIEFANNDAGVPHNVAIHEGSATGREIFKGEIFNGVETRTYDAPALPAGQYAFICTVHPNMVITVTAR